MHSWKLNYAQIYPHLQKVTILLSFNAIASGNYTCWHQSEVSGGCDLKLKQQRPDRSDVYCMKTVHLPRTVVNDNDEIISNGSTKLLNLKATRIFDGTHSTLSSTRTRLFNDKVARTRRVKCVTNLLDLNDCFTIKITPLSRKKAKGGKITPNSVHSTHLTVQIYQICRHQAWMKATIYTWYNRYKNYLIDANNKFVIRRTSTNAWANS